MCGVEGWGGGEDALEHVFGFAVFGVDERFGLRVAVGGDGASAVEGGFGGWGG